MGSGGGGPGVGAGVGSGTGVGITAAGLIALLPTVGDARTAGRVSGCRRLSAARTADVLDLTHGEVGRNRGRCLHCADAGLAVVRRPPSQRRVPLLNLAILVVVAAVVWPLLARLRRSTSERRRQRWQEEERAGGVPAYEPDEA
jgi:hypothetical protein